MELWVTPKSNHKVQNYSVNSRLNSDNDGEEKIGDQGNGKL